MTNEAQNGITCSQFEALLAEALDAESVQDATAGELAGLPAAFRAAFAAHRESCAKCGPLYAETREGMLLLAGLEEIEPPRNLVHNILAATSHVESKASVPGKQVQAGWLERVRSRWVPEFAGVLRSRFVASFCMAFFSLSLTLSLAGVKISDLAHMAAHPIELRKSVVLEYTQVQARVLNYYDNMRLVYEVESRVRELKKAATPVQNNQDKGTQPDQQNWNQPVPGSPGFEEVGQPQTQESYRRNRDQRDARQLVACLACSGPSDIRKVTGMIAESTRKNEGAEI